MAATAPQLPGGCLEVCVDSALSARLALAGGATRLELCDALAEGGLTPSWGKIRQVVSIAAAAQPRPVPVFVLIRPRGGDFLYDPDERQTILADIAACRSSGAAGVVAGALRPCGRPDLAFLRQCILAAAPLHFTFHRAVDVASVWPSGGPSGGPSGQAEGEKEGEGEEDIGFAPLLSSLRPCAPTDGREFRVLTSGGAATAAEGAAGEAPLLELVSQAARHNAAQGGGVGGGSGWVRVVAAGGVSSANAGALLSAAIRAAVAALQGVWASRPPEPPESLPLPLELHGTFREPTRRDGGMQWRRDPPLCMGQAPPAASAASAVSARGPHPEYSIRVVDTAEVQRVAQAVAAAEAQWASEWSECRSRWKRYELRVLF
jgi:copper homeostasis protein